jgi:hypothetical protein
MEPYRVLEMTLLSALIKSHSKVSKNTQSISFSTLDKINGVGVGVVFSLNQTLLSVETTLAVALFLCRNKCQNDLQFLLWNDIPKNPISSEFQFWIAQEIQKNCKPTMSAFIITLQQTIF